MTISKTTVWAASAVLALGLGTSTAEAATTLYFQDLDGSGVGTTLGPSQLSVEVTEAGQNSSGENLVQFLFSNVGSTASSITDIYFSKVLDPFLVAFNGFTSIKGVVDYGVGATPPDLPQAGNTWMTFFSADSNPPRQPNGINPGETLGILFSLQQPFSALIAQVNLGGSVGVHVQGFDNGGSDSLVTAPVPVPAAGLMLLSALGGLAALRRRRAAA